MVHVGCNKFSKVKNNNMRKYLAFSLFLILIIGCKVSSTKKADRTIYVQNENKASKDWKLIWEEDFTINELDTTKWTRIPPNKADWGNYMTSDPKCYDILEGKLYLR